MANASQASEAVHSQSGGCGSGVLATVANTEVVAAGWTSIGTAIGKPPRIKASR